jgi:MFS family permease
VLQPNLLAGGVMVMLIPWSTDPLLLASIYTVFMACFSALITLATAYTIDSLDRAGASRGEGFGQIRIGGSIGWIPGSLSGGAIASAMGLEGVFIMTGIITLSSVIILLPLRECHGERESRGSGVRGADPIEGAGWAAPPNANPGVHGQLRARKLPSPSTWRTASEPLPSRSLSPSH